MHPYMRLIAGEKKRLFAVFSGFMKPGGLARN
jgi:hypothetical protein